MENPPSVRVATRFATGQDLRECQSLHRKFGTSYYLATRAFPRRLRLRVHALYAFVRIPDDFVDDPREANRATTAASLADWRRQVVEGMNGVRPESPAVRAFCDVAAETRIPIEEPLAFLDAMEADLVVERYATYEDLQSYMRGSAVAVAKMMCRIVEARLDERAEDSARKLAEAMQLTNFLRDIGEDARRGRIYLPQEDLKRFGIAEGSLVAGSPEPGFADLMKFEIQRARTLYAEADPAIGKLPREARRGVRLASRLYAAILDRIEDGSYDVLTRRHRTSALQKLAIVARVLASSG